MSLGWFLVLFFVVLCVICLLVYVLVVRAFYWGDKKNEPKPRDKSKQ
jgi:NADH:ubiquinone oxidoreductase subunit 2 (subunit N)